MGRPKRKPKKPAFQPGQAPMCVTCGKAVGVEGGEQCAECLAKNPLKDVPEETAV